MKTVKLIFLFGLVAMVAWNCSNLTSSDDGGFASVPYANATMVSPADSLLGLAQQIPGFGGLFINDSDQLNIYLTQPAEQKETAIQVLSSSELIKKALSNSSASVSNMKVNQGQYTFIKLYTWKKEISSKVLIMDPVYSVGIDQSQNKVSVGVKNKSTLDSVNRKLVELNIPEEAVMIYQMTPPELY